MMKIYILFKYLFCTCIKMLNYCRYKWFRVELKSGLTNRTFATY